MIGYFVRAGDIHVSEVFHPHQRLFRDIIEKHIGSKKYGESLKLILIEYLLEGKHLPLPEKSIKVLNYSKKELAITVVVGVSKEFESWSEQDKRRFIYTTTERAVELVKERMAKKGFSDIDFERLFEDLNICSKEYMESPAIL
jgi:hypothetical protein